MNRDWITMQTKQYRICKKGQEDNDRTSRRRRLVFLGITIAVIIIILILLLSRCGTDQKEPIIAEITQPPGFSMIEGNLNAAQSRSKEEIQNELRRKVEEGMMNISMNLNPVFANGFSEGNLMIVNEEVNRHPQIVEIYYKGENRQNGDQPIYRSGVIPVGEQIAMDKLDVNLSDGTYNCIAYFYSVDDDGCILGTAAAEIKIQVGAKETDEAKN